MLVHLLCMFATHSGGAAVVITERDKFFLIKLCALFFCFAILGMYVHAARIGVLSCLLMLINAMYCQHSCTHTGVVVQGSMPGKLHRAAATDVY